PSWSASPRSATPRWHTAWEATPASWWNSASRRRPWSIGMNTCSQGCVEPAVELPPQRHPWLIGEQSAEVAGDGLQPAAAAHLPRGVIGQRLQYRVQRWPPPARIRDEGLLLRGQAPGIVVRAAVVHHAIDLRQ